MNPPDDTIAAIATAPGESGIAIVRISGPQSFSLADSVFQGPGPKPSERESHTAVHGRISEEDQTIIDEVILIKMCGPNSYTGDDVIEIQGHGGSAVARRVLKRVLAAGARSADPGEFTRRAFLNGRIDLLQAEAVLDLIRARSDRAAVAAVEQLEGGLSKSIDQLYEETLDIASDLEATLDFSDDELPPTVLPEIRTRVTGILQAFGRLLSTWDEGHLLRDGAVVVIMGRTNVGKSTMLNTLLERDRAIVSDHPGTTRDVIEEQLVLKGIPVRIVDTAGFRESDCDVEKEGIRRTRSQADLADLKVYMVDGSEELGEDDRIAMEDLDPDKSIVVANKSDLGQMISEDMMDGLTLVTTSLKSGQGLEDIKRALIQKLESTIDLEARPHAVISERHRKLIQDAKDEVEKSMELLASDREDVIDIAASHLKGSLEMLGQINGRVYHDELLDSIFTKFCIGK